MYREGTSWFPNYVILFFFIYYSFLASYLDIDIHTKYNLTITKAGKNLLLARPYAKNLVKIGFLMPTAKNGFQILNFHPKKHVI